MIDQPIIRRSGRSVSMTTYPELRRLIAGATSGEWIFELSEKASEATIRARRNSPDNIRSSDYTAPLAVLDCATDDSLMFSPMDREQLANAAYIVAAQPKRTEDLLDTIDALSARVGVLEEESQKWRRQYLDAAYKLNHFHSCRDAGEPDILSRILKRCSVEGRDLVVDGFMRARASILNGNKGDLPRQIMESYLDADCELLMEAFEDIQAARSALTPAGGE